MSQVIRSPKQYDVCIIGSGAGGGMAAKILTEGGLNCALLEAGPNVNPEKVSSAPDGVFLPPPKPRCTELMVKKACDKLNIICIPSRLAILTRSVNGRLPCHYCGQCGRGCITASNFSSSQVLLPPAMKTGKLTLITGAMAREILVGKDGKAEGVSYIDKATRM